MAVVFKITYPIDRARARRLQRPRGALNRGATEQRERYLTSPFRYAQLGRVSCGISEEAPDAADLVVDNIARAV